MEDEKTSTLTIQKLSVSELVEENNLDYESSIDLSVAKSRKLIRSDFQSTTYTTGSNSTATVYLNVSDGYVDPLNSYLTFTAFFKTGDEKTAADAINSQKLYSILDAIESITFTTKSGKEIERVDKVNLLQHHLIKWTHDNNYIETALSVMGYRKDYSATNALEVASKEIQYCIPMKYLLGMFNPHQKRLLPNMLMSGARVDIKFEDKNKIATYSADQPKGEIQFERMAIVMDTVILSDGILSALNKQASAKTGLELSFDTFHHDQDQVSSTSVNLKSSKALSKANWAFVALVPTPADATAEAKAISFDTETSTATTGLTQQQWRLGSQYFPATRLEVDKTASVAIENYMNALYVMRNMRGGPCAVSYDDFKAGYEIACVSLERSQTSDLRGQTISNGRYLEAILKRAGSVACDTHFFVNYTKLLQIYHTTVTVGE